MTNNTCASPDVWTFSHTAVSVQLGLLAAPARREIAVSISRVALLVRVSTLLISSLVSTTRVSVSRSTLDRTVNSLTIVRLLRVQMAERAQTNQMDTGLSCLSLAVNISQ